MAYSLAMGERLLTVAETALFIRHAEDLWNDGERAAFVDFIAANPEAGDVVPDSGGMRVIYFYHDDAMPLYLLMIYAKARRENWSPDEKRRAQALVAAIKQAHRRR